MNLNHKDNFHKEIINNNHSIKTNNTKTDSKTKFIDHLFDNLFDAFYEDKLDGRYKNNLIKFFRSDN